MVREFCSDPGQTLYNFHTFRIKENISTAGIFFTSLRSAYVQMSPKSNLPRCSLLIFNISQKVYGSGIHGRQAPIIFKLLHLDINNCAESGNVRENSPQKVRESRGILSGHVSGNPDPIYVIYLASPEKQGVRAGNKKKNSNAQNCSPANTRACQATGNFG